MIYTTIEGDRWDTIAGKYYGDASLYEPILRENPTYAYQYPTMLPGGLSITVPYMVIPPDPPDPSPSWQTD